MTAGCPALLVSAPASGQGKTSVTAALARWHRRRGCRVRVFKTGPDCRDPAIHTRASDAPVYQLDAWMGGEADVRSRLHAAAVDADLILIEGVMGLFDGNPSSANLAALLDVPVLAVIDANAMAQTFGAMALGLATYRDDVTVFGVAANRTGSAYHAQLLQDSMPPSLNWLGALPRDPAVTLPEQRNGLALPDAVSDIDTRLDALADAWAAHASTALPAPTVFPAATTRTVPTALQGRRIAVARDAAFTQLYPANLDLLRAAGAEVVFFSPLADAALPACDAVWLPGGTPETHGDTLSRNRAWKRALQEHVDAGRPLLAEGGGMLALLDTLTVDTEPTRHLAGLIPGSADVGTPVVGMGLQEVTLAEGTLRGSAFHHARLAVSLEPAAVSTNANGGPASEPVYRRGRLTASMMKLYFPSDPTAATALFLP